MTKTCDVHYLCYKDAGIELILCNRSTLCYPLHNHVSVFTIGMVLNGAIHLSIQDDCHIYTKEQTFSILPYIPHSIQAQDEYSLIILCINKKRFTNSNIEHLKKDIAKILKQSLGFYCLKQEQIMKFTESLKDMEDYQSICREPLIERIRKLLELYPEKRFFIEKLAQTTFISKYHFIRKFKQEVGLTPHQFIIQNRVRKAQRLLNQDNSMTEAALNAGFCDQSHFIKQFEKIVGLTPSLYKNSCTILYINSI